MNAGNSIKMSAMVPVSLIRILQLPLRGFANCIRRVHVNRISFEQSDAGKALVRKRRSWFAGALIFLGNVAFRFRQVPLRVLWRGEWLAWESAVKLALRNESIPAGTDLLCEVIPGQPLSQRLSDREMASADRLDLLGTAVLALRDLHQATIPLPGFEQPIALSHGDAAVSNVLYCDQTKRAEWFDFDLRHDLRADADQRHADDLRSLIFSASLFCPESELESLVLMIKREYGSEHVWAALQQQVGSRWFWFDLFHLSQTRRLRAESPVARHRLSATDKAIVRLIENSFAWNSLD